MSPAKLREIATSLQCQEDENEDMMEEKREEYSQFMEEKAALMHSAKRSKRRMEDSSDGLCICIFLVVIHVYTYHLTLLHHFCFVRGRRPSQTDHSYFITSR